jgi:tetratricopeptide (TPR) repeat protein
LLALTIRRRSPAHSRERALALAPDDVSVLGPVGVALCYVGFLEEGVRYTERAVRKAPGSGHSHFYCGTACMLLNLPEKALSHLNTASRLMPEGHLMWVVKAWQSNAYRESGRLAEANAAIDESLALLPTYALAHVKKALCCIQLGRDVEARGHIVTARRQGWDFAQAERQYRRLLARSPRLDADVATIHALYAATEPGT